MNFFPFDLFSVTQTNSIAEECFWLKQQKIVFKSVVESDEYALSH